MIEIIAAVVTTIDILIVYTILQLRRGRFMIALWTTFLNMLLPLVGFYMGEWTVHFFAGWGPLLSGVLIGLVGLHMLLDDGEQPSVMDKISPFFLALLVSIDAFTVSVTFGMMQLNKWLFIFVSGFFSFVFSIVALLSTGRIKLINGTYIRRITGIVFIIIGVMSFIF
ncbi:MULTISPECIES: manganese efflux pump [Sporosarcina]|uniref:Putative Mn2+ efflux pump MntP n=1 Tax=Sporosarcina newyorkensis TaxID=759851 RepID=A0A1T4XWW8_9BACL|nr:manganese efflux pump [Sporosarcina newyorkensis]SKA93994.1 Putative Mn2+ efflux pump MntP [Sporosarcina newyorkensis]